MPKTSTVLVITRKPAPSAEEAMIYQPQAPGPVYRAIECMHGVCTYLGRYGPGNKKGNQIGDVERHNRQDDMTKLVPIDASSSVPGKLDTSS